MYGFGIELMQNKDIVITQKKKKKTLIVSPLSKSQPHSLITLINYFVSNCSHLKISKSNENLIYKPIWFKLLMYINNPYQSMYPVQPRLQF